MIAQTTHLVLARQSSNFLPYAQGLRFWRDLLDSQRDEMQKIGTKDGLQHSLALSRMVEKAGLQLTALTAPHVFALDDIINEKPSDEVRS